MRTVVHGNFGAKVYQGVWTDAFNSLSGLTSGSVLYTTEKTSCVRVGPLLSDHRKRFRHQGLLL